MILDIGCGSRARGDINLDLFRERGVNIIAHAEHLPFRYRSFDKILCSQVLEHLDNPFEAMREINRVLKNDGIALIDFPKPSWSNNSKVRLFEILLNFPLALRNFGEWIDKVRRIHSRDPRVFHKWIINPSILNKHLVLEETIETKDILLNFLYYGRKARFFRQKPKIYTAYLCRCSKSSI